MRIKIRIHQIRWICRIRRVPRIRWIRRICRIRQVRRIRRIRVHIRRIRVLKIASVSCNFPLSRYLMLIFLINIIPVVILIIRKLMFLLCSIKLFFLPQGNLCFNFCHDYVFSWFWKSQGTWIQQDFPEVVLSF